MQSVRVVVGIAPVAFTPADVEHPEQLAALSRLLTRNVPAVAAKVDPLESKSRPLNPTTKITIPDPSPR